MAFCTKCGAQNAEGVGFCTTCGNALGATPPAPAGAPPVAPQYAPPAAPPQYAPPGAPVMYQAAPMAPAQPNMLMVMWNSLDLGAKIAGIGALVAAIAFFLPMAGTAPSQNGVDIANMSSGTYGGSLVLAGLGTAFWFRLILSLVAVGLLYFYYNNDMRTKIIVAAAHISIGSMWGFQILRVAAGGSATSTYQFGWYLHTLGLLAIAVGGLMSLLSLTNRLRGVR